MFSNCLKVALQSATYFEDKSFDDKRVLYKKAIKTMVELRTQVREDAEETVDYDEYADNIRAMLNKHIGGVNIQESKGAYLVGNMGKNAKPEEMTPDEARNKKDVITGRVAKMIEQDLADDPYAQEYFSKLLKKAIDQTKELFDAPVKQYLLFADFEQQVKDRVVEGIPAERFADLEPKMKRSVQAYYGLFLTHGKLAEDQAVDYSIQVNDIVHKAVSEFSINQQEIENHIRTGLLMLLHVDLGLDKAQALITDVIQITRLGLSRLQDSRYQGSGRN